MSASVPEKKKPLEHLICWAWRLALAAAILSTIGYFSSPTVSPLMCKVYG